MVNVGNDPDEVCVRNADYTNIEIIAEGSA